MDQPQDDIRQRFRDLHREGFFLMPNPWDVGSARILAARGFPALATTSSGFAATLGLPDQHTTLDQLVDHVAAITQAVEIPLNVDAEYAFAAETTGIAETADRLAEAGAAGFSIEDFNPATKAIDPADRAIERVAAAAEAARRHGLVLTARAENLIHGVDDLDDTIARLVAYRDVGAEVVYAPGLLRVEDITRVVEAVTVPLNVLILRTGPSADELAAAGVRRVSTGGNLAWAAYGALVRAADELKDAGTVGFSERNISAADRAAAFG